MSTLARTARLVRPPKLRIAAVVAVAAVMATLFAAAAPAKPASETIVLPGATSAEGITDGRGSTFYAGELFTGDIFRGDLQRGTAEEFIDVPDGRMAVGMSFDDATGLLFVAGGATGQGYVYDTTTGSTVAVYQLADPNSSPFINDVATTKDGAWFTNSRAGALYFISLAGGAPGAASALTLTGPAADTSSEFNLNGIASSADGGTLVVAHSGNGELYTVDPVTGESELIAGVSVPNVDGIVLEGRRLWAVQNFLNQISAVRLSSDLSSGEIEKVITSDHFQIPATAAIHGDSLAAVNAKFDTGFPPTAEEFEVVVVRR